MCLQKKHLDFFGAHYESSISTKVCLEPSDVGLLGCCVQGSRKWPPPGRCGDGRLHWKRLGTLDWKLFFRQNPPIWGGEKTTAQPTSNKLEPATATRTATTAALQSNAQTPPPPPPPSPPSPSPRQLGLLFRLASCTAKQPSATTTTTVAETFLCFLGSRIVAKRPDIARVFWVVGKILSYCLMRHHRLEKRWWPSQKNPLRFANQASFLQKVAAEVSCPNFLFSAFVRLGARCLVLCWFRGCDVVRPLLHTTLGWSTRWKSLGSSGLDGDVVGNFGMPIGSAWKILNSVKHL